MATPVQCSEKPPSDIKDFECLSTEPAEPMIGDDVMNVRDAFLKVNSAFRVVSHHWPHLARQPDLVRSPGSALHCYVEEQKGFVEDLSNQVRNLQQMVVKLVASTRLFGNQHREVTNEDDDDDPKINAVLWALSELLWSLVDVRRRAEFQLTHDVFTVECLAQNDGRGYVSLTYLPASDSVTCILFNEASPESRILVGPRVTTVTMRDLLIRKPDARQILCEISHSLTRGGVVINAGVESQLSVPEVRRLCMPEELRLYGRSGYAKVCVHHDYYRGYAEPNAYTYSIDFIEFSELEWMHFR